MRCTGFLDYNEALGLVHGAAVKQAQTFVPGAGTWACYLWFGVRSELSHLRSARKVRARILGANVISMESPVIQAQCGVPCLAIADAESKIDARFILAAGREGISDEDLRLYLRYMLDGATYRELGEELGCSRQRIQQRVSAAGAKLRKNLREVRL